MDKIETEGNEGKLGSKGYKVKRWKGNRVEELKVEWVER